MESSWSGDYPGDTAQYWSDEECRPYLIHYYGESHKLHEQRPVSNVFRELLSKEEQEEWIKQSLDWFNARVEWDRERMALQKGEQSRLHSLSARLKKAAKILVTGGL